MRARAPSAYAGSPQIASFDDFRPSGSGLFLTLDSSFSGVQCGVRVDGTLGCWSEGADFDQVTQPPPVPSSLSSSPNPARSADTITFTATVHPLVTGGSATFRANGAALGSPVPVVNGQAHLALPALALGTGTRQITADFSGTAAVEPSTSPPVQQTIVRTCLLGLCF